LGSGWGVDSSDDDDDSGDDDSGDDDSGDDDDDNNDDDVARSGSKEEERSIEHDNFVLYESNITAAHNTDYYDAIDSEDSFDSESEDK
jgi:hypothetical protein